MPSLIIQKCPFTFLRCRWSLEMEFFLVFWTKGCPLPDGPACTTSDFGGNVYVIRFSIKGDPTDPLVTVTPTNNSNVFGVHLDVTGSTEGGTAKKFKECSLDGLDLIIMTLCSVNKTIQGDPSSRKVWLSLILEVQPSVWFCLGWWEVGKMAEQLGAIR